MSMIGESFYKELEANIGSMKSVRLWSSFRRSLQSTKDDVHIANYSQAALIIPTTAVHAALSPANATGQDPKHRITLFGAHEAISPITGDKALYLRTGGGHHSSDSVRIETASTIAKQERLILR